MPHRRLRRHVAALCAHRPDRRPPRRRGRARLGARRLRRRARGGPRAAALRGPRRLRRVARSGRHGVGPTGCRLAAVPSLHVRRWDAAHGTVHLWVTTTSDGPGAAWALTARLGDRVDAVGPRGKIALHPDATEHLFVIDDSGLAAMCAMAESVPPGSSVHAVLALEHATGAVPGASPPTSRRAWRCERRAVRATTPPSCRQGRRGVRRARPRDGRRLRLRRARPHPADRGDARRPRGRSCARGHQALLARGPRQRGERGAGPQLRVTRRRSARRGCGASTARGTGPRPASPRG